jgi:hypothetical protein
MISQGVSMKIDKQKKAIIFFLYLGTTVIMFLGAFYGTYSFLNDIKIKVLNSSVPGIVFGLLAMYLGLRYFFMVSKFKLDFFDSDSKFSWSNFKREKKKRKISGSKK